MKERFKGMIIGLIIGVMITATTVIASTGAIQKTLHYNNIRITMNGNEIRPTDVNGNYVEPFIIDGTTYLPVRGVANSLGLNVEWDGATNTVKLFEDGFDNTKTEVEKYIESYGSLLVEAVKSGIESQGIDCTASVKGEGNKMILEARITGLDDVSSEEKATIQNYYNENIEEIKASYEKITEYIPSLESIVFNICEEDGDLIATMNIDF